MHSASLRLSPSSATPLQPLLSWESPAWLVGLLQTKPPRVVCGNLQFLLACANKSAPKQGSKLEMTTLIFREREKDNNSAEEEMSKPLQRENCIPAPY